MLAACVIAVLLVPATASASTTGFHIFNFTSTPLKLDSVGVEFDFAGGSDAPLPPREGDVLQPGADGDHNHIELVYYPFSSANVATLDYKRGNQTISVFATDGHCFTCFGRDPQISCTSVPRDLRCLVDGSTLTITDPPGTVHNVPADHSQEQLEVLRALCSKANELIKCKFDPKRRDREAFGSPHLVGGVIPNCTEKEVLHKVKTKDKEIASNSYGISYTAETEFKFPFGAVKLALEQKYEHEWGTEHEFEHALDVPIPPGYRGWIEGRNPVIRDTGEFILEVGHTTWKLHDVYFDSPDPTREGALVWVPREEKMTPDQKRAECHGSPPPHKLGRIPRAPDYYATIKQRGTKKTEPLVGGRESTTLIARGGNDILRGASGNDRLFGGPGSDLIVGGPGSDTIVDSRGRTRVSTGAGGRSGPDTVDVRDGSGGDRVICGKGQAIVRADRSDRLRHCGG
jgi:hypothetical protein